MLIRMMNIKIDERKKIFWPEVDSEDYTVNNLPAGYYNVSIRDSKDQITKCILF